MWKKLSDKIEEEVLQRYKVEVNKREANKGRGQPSEWRMVQRVKKYQPRKWSEDCRERILSCFSEHDLQRRQGMRESQREEEEMRQQQRMKYHERHDKENQVKGQSRRKQQLVGQ